MESPTTWAGRYARALAAPMDVALKWAVMEVVTRGTFEATTLVTMAGQTPWQPFDPPEDRLALLVAPVDKPKLWRMDASGGMTLVDTGGAAGPLAALAGGGGGGGAGGGAAGED